MSDGILYPRYIDIYNKCINKNLKSIAFLGFSSHQDVTSHIVSKNKDAVVDFYDIELDGDYKWDINSDWELKQKYDLIVCLRCPYFAKDPKKFLQKCHQNLNPGGYVFVDWGLGDHWRFKNYRIGWVNSEKEYREYANYDGNKQYLWSCFWDDNIKDHFDTHMFLISLGVENNIDKILEKEIGKEYIVDYKAFNDYFDIVNAQCIYNPRPRPQLYTVLIGKKS